MVTCSDYLMLFKGSDEAMAHLRCLSLKTLEDIYRGVTESSVHPITPEATPPTDLKPLARFLTSRPGIF